MPFLVYFGRLCDEKCGVFHGHLVFLWPCGLKFWFDIQGNIWLPRFGRFGLLHKEISGNPVLVVPNQIGLHGRKVNFCVNDK
jgi:hypothetical protein